MTEINVGSYQFFDSVILSKIIYGLETVQLNQSLLKKLDAFQLRQLRKIIGWQPTFIDRSKTNASAIEEINRIIISANPNTQNCFKPISEKIQLRQAKLLGHILRASNDDPMRQITFKPSTGDWNHPNKKRVGRPRANWLFETCKFTYEQVIFKEQGRIYTNTPLCNLQLYESAQERVF